MTSANVEQITRKFFHRFKAECANFRSSIDGFLTSAEQEQFVSFLLIRLMFLYFLQHRGLLDGDRHYLSHHLRKMQEGGGENTFYSHFLSPFFYDCLASQNSYPESRSLFGSVLRLGSGLFTFALLKQDPERIQVPDLAFARLFAFFDTYQWHLDDRQLQHENEINPDVLGYVLEQYVNQQEMGAYYTKEDVTTYIASNTIIPALFDMVARRCPNAFSPGGIIWKWLQIQPDRYIYQSVRSEDYLSAETTREYAARYARYLSLQRSMKEGTISTIDDFITHNLDIRRFALDVITICEDQELIEAFYCSLQAITIFDPTCGSGAFLLAALKILEPLYVACLERRKGLMADSSLGIELSTRRYCVIEAILTRNLYGIDIMEEAVEICKLRLLLKLLSHVECVQEVGPVSAVHENIRVGNVLNGYMNDLRNEPGTPISQNVQQRLHQQMGLGKGFDVIIGNPPYVEYSSKTFPYTIQGYETLACANVYPYVIEHSRSLLAPQGRQGMILPLAAFATRNMIPLIEGLRRWFPCMWVSFYHFRPSMLFSGGKTASIPTAIYLAKAHGQEMHFSTHVNKWFSEQREMLFASLRYCQITAPQDVDNRHYYPKFGSPLENTIMSTVLRQQTLKTYLARVPSQNRMWYRSAGGLYWKIFVNTAWPYHGTANKHCSFQEAYDRDVFVALLNSSLFWWYYTVTFDTFNLKDYMIFGFRFTYPESQETVSKLKALCQRLMNDFQQHARHLKRGRADSYTLYARKSKHIIDEIDYVLARHYGFTDEELDFIIHYDSKFRLTTDR